MEELIDVQMAQYVLPNIFEILTLLNEKQFVRQVLVKIKPLFQVREPIQCLEVLLDNLEIIFQKSGKKVIRDGKFIILQISVFLNKQIIIS